ncbi:hypothetical protein [Chamaesiphon sp.]|uniref:hypothetical protein n=1 Tax=Chamaesiphon sp. TaxID=2814140 RepID=UPI0035946382
MNEKTIEVSGLYFTRANIFGCYLPTRTSIESVLVKIPDKRNKRKICERSNELVELHSQCLDIPDSFFDDWVCTIEYRVEKTDRDRKYNLDKKLTVIMLHQACIAGLDGRGIARNSFIKNWFEGMLGGFDHDTQKLRKMLGNTLECVHNRSKPIEKYKNVKLEPLTSREKECPEYVTARMLFESFQEQICLILQYNSLMLSFEYQIYQLIYEGFKLTEGIKDKTCINVCTKCNVHFESKKRPSIKICNPCKNRSAEQKKVSRRIDRGSWVPIGTGKCGGGCESLKIKINTFSSCLKCYISNS